MLAVSRNNMSKSIISNIKDNMPVDPFSLHVYKVRYDNNLQLNLNYMV
jgi:hypothetical protein